MTIVTGSSQWYGSFFEGTGNLSTETTDTIRSAPYTYASRFEGAPGAIPEELLVTGHAGCYNHALANIARKNGVAVESITTTAQLTMGTDNQGSDGHGYSVEGIHLIVQADLPDITDEKFQEIADDARKLCSISKILRVPITLDATRVALPAIN
ncbi:MAG: lipoyl-dependent peroxiredoxin [Mycobacterium sp.]|jgi:osmotically inducible protein OsmC|nr:lipoyl-dependent peroxiredoxin [Mycobacterium sp.]MDT5171029.1 lipoyl-dependent peroxiredoxin [Mycobacterium sp.]MDT5307384.1 lipoyl-dependent peroxiredoxin [Mycobacterium sp.]MDT5321556.1 lipoyl-dependent peroxiredoxin [Mycobacterium sp.]